MSKKEEESFENPKEPSADKGYDFEIPKENIPKNNNEKKIKKPNCIPDYESYFKNWEDKIIPINALDSFGNSLILASFCYSITAIIYGFVLCNTFKKYALFEGFLLSFGGVGQLTTGFMEYFKGQTFPAVFYITFGSLAFSHHSFFLKQFDHYGEDNTNGIFSYDCTCAFYIVWFAIGCAILVSALKINYVYIACSILMCVYFLIEFIGYARAKKKCYGTVGGIILIISGFVHLYITVTQIINKEGVIKLKLPTGSLKKNNKIDN